MELRAKIFNRFNNNSNNTSWINKTVTEKNEILETERGTHIEVFSRKRKTVLTRDPVAASEQIFV